MKLTLEQLRSLRMQNQLLAGSQVPTPLEVVRHLLCVQAQDYAASQWAIAVRTTSPSLAVLDEAYDSGQIVRSWPMRGTLFAVAATDLRWLLGLTAERTLKAAHLRQKALRLDAATFEAAEVIARQRLQGGRRCSREQLVGALRDGGIEVDNQRGYHLIWWLAHQAVIVLGPTNDGKGQDFVLCDEWLPDVNPLDGDEALATLVLRYVEGHGPVDLKTLSWWCKLPQKDLKVGLEAVGDQLVEFSFETTTQWLSQRRAAHLDADLDITDHVVALTGFDEYVLGYQDRSFCIDDAHASLVVPGKNGVFLPTIVAAGEVVGTWRRTTRTTTMAIDAEPFLPLDPAVEEAFAAKASEYADFYGRTVVNG